MQKQANKVIGCQERSSQLPGQAGRGQLVKVWGFGEVFPLVVFGCTGQVPYLLTLPWYRTLPCTLPKG
jgi:hypothetical protein